MAAENSNVGNSVQISYGKLSDKSEIIACECCNKMKLELSDVKLETSSLREIIRELQQEIREIIQSTLPTVNKGNEVYECEESYKLATNKEWTTLSSSRRNKLPYQNRNLDQLPLVTSNKFSTLANLNHDNQFPEKVFHVKHPNPLSNYQKKQPGQEYNQRTNRTIHHSQNCSKVYNRDNRPLHTA